MNLYKLDLLNPIRHKLDNIVICNCQQAQLLCRLIPASCPFARDIKIFGVAESRYEFVSRKGAKALSYKEKGRSFCDFIF
ncbi:Mo-dependent nitrogenase C-terminal domain-containing protein [Anabaena azotica]|uniref:Mo-dependent nitrogenase C-terminal domain-containing protein n=1 Tax=Anabaena azotica FACHB-119 TaxID=947527 RepID=A0ABR8DA61_9NOST|nr:Mo-dependent nitrogenase C-terminal domain-containing protein [Anabaena azotica]MBD2503323.1 hypothetical protein [Anabaena azotica FACHB-119]